MKLLCLSENESLGQRVCEEAERLSWTTVFVTDRKMISTAVRQYDPDLLLVDVDGVNDLDWWSGSGVGADQLVIFLNQEITEEFMSKALDLGADAFLPKSLFSSRHFEARIRSLLRRRGLGQNKRFVARFDLMIDGQRYCAEIQGKPLNLTLTEFKILRELATDDERVVSRQEIQTRVFGQSTLSNRSLDVHVCALRKKLKKYGLDVDSVRSVGYRLNPCPN